MLEVDHSLRVTDQNVLMVTRSVYWSIMFTRWFVVPRLWSVVPIQLGKINHKINIFKPLEKRDQPPDSRYRLLDFVKRPQKTNSL